MGSKGLGAVCASKVAAEVNNKNNETCRVLMDSVADSERVRGVTSQKGGFVCPDEAARP
jgi:hypothetical protein